MGEKLRALREKSKPNASMCVMQQAAGFKLSNTAELSAITMSQLTDANFRLKKFRRVRVADKLQKRLGSSRMLLPLTRMKDRADSFVLAPGN